MNAIKYDQLTGHRDDLLFTHRNVPSELWRQLNDPWVHAAK